MTHTELMIGKPTSEFLQVRVLRRGAPEATDYWDGNWLVANVSLKVGGFSGSFEADLRTTDFTHFESELRTLYRSLSGQAELTTDQGQLAITVTGDGHGHFEARCAARDEAGVGNSLNFTLLFDQTEIPAILTQLEDIASSYPVRGAPAA